MKPKNDCSQFQIVESALLAIGCHPDVRMTVQAVNTAAADGSLTVKLTLFLKTDSPMCCPEPGCYIRFLGRSRSKVPSALASALELKRPPQVTIHATLKYEDGYQHTELDLGNNVTTVVTYHPCDFEANSDSVT